MKILIDNEILRVSVIERSTTAAMLCFSGIGHQMGDVNVQGEEFLKISQSATSIFISDKNRSWGNDIDFPLLHDSLAHFTKAKTVNCIGNSMGGFLAVLATRFFKVDVAIAFVPQYSVSKQVVPTENRWDEYVDQIKNWRFPSLEGCFQSSTTYYLFGCAHGKDGHQLEKFPDGDNIHKIYFGSSNFHHKVARYLKDAGKLYPVIADCLNKRNATEIIQAHLSDSDYQAFSA